MGVLVQFNGLIKAQSSVAYRIGKIKIDSTEVRK